MILITLAFIALTLMISSYVFKRPALSLAGAIVWLLLGIWSLSLSTATWDIYYDLFVVGVGMFFLGLFEAMELRPKMENTETPMMDYWNREKQRYQESQSKPRARKRRKNSSELDDSGDDI